MKNKIYVIGIGSGTEDYLLPIAKKKIENSDCLIGSERVLEAFKHLNHEKVYLKNNLDSVIEYIKKNKSKKKIAVLVSGDTGIYSFLNKISQEFDKDEYEVIPGISSMQIAFAKIGELWHDAKILSLHGRTNKNLAKDIKENSKVFLFTDAKFPPEKIASFLLKNNIKNRKVFVFENLTYNNERILEISLKELSEMKGFELCVMIIMKKRK